MLRMPRQPVVDCHVSDRLYPHTGGIMEGLEAIFRWMHVFAGIIWIGHLYFFNWVNGPLPRSSTAPQRRSSCRN